MDDTERLIQLIRSSPIIYDVTLPEYRNIRKKDEQYKKIANILNENVKIIKKKWKNLRDNYNKHLKSLKNTNEESSVRKYRTWPWANEMAFLKNYMQIATTEAKDVLSITMTTEELEESEATGTDHLTTKPMSRASASPLAHNSRVSVSSPAHTSGCKTPGHFKTPQSSGIPEKRAKLTSEQDIRPSLLEQLIPYLYRSPLSDIDDIDLDCLGFARTIKKFSVERQSKVKFAIVKYLHKEELAQQQENSAHLARANSHSTTTPSSHQPPSPLSTYSGPPSSPPHSTDPPSPYSDAQSPSL